PHAQPDADFVAGAGQSAGTGSSAEPQRAAGVLNCLSVLSMSELRPDTAGFSGANLNAVFGGIRLDLSAVVAEHETVTVEIFALLGQVQIVVPSHWVVRSHVSAIAASHVLRRPS